MSHSENAENQETVEVANSSEKIELPELEGSERLALIEALLFASGEPLSAELISSVARIPEEEVTDLLSQLKESLDNEERGIELVEVAHKFQLRTKPIFLLFLRELKSGGPRRLSGQALETLSIVAYRQPIVKSDIEKIRGVDATPTLKTLLERNLIRIIGHQPTVGQPALYGTTDEFLTLFGLRSLEELPSLRDIRDLESDPGESGEVSSAENLMTDDSFDAESSIEN